MHRAEPQVAVPDRQLINALLRPGAFDHPVQAPELIETHISWVILAGEYAYKIKKPLALGFLDFSELEQRKFYCAEEIRLNQASAPDIYVDVMPITDGANPRFGGDGEPVEFAVRMRRFDADMRLDVQLDDGRLTDVDMKELGQAIALRHESSPRIPDDQRDRVLAKTHEFIWENFGWLEGRIDEELLEFLQRWTRSELDATEHRLGQRFDDGFVRECHGDLHLANLVRMPGGIRTFDCIDFNADLRNTDVMCDTAFLVMDLVARKRHDLAAGFLNRYLEQTGDYTGMAVLDLFFVYRCLVRAKVAAISNQESSDPGEQNRWLGRAQSYCDMAKRQATKSPPILIVMHGLSGSGKTWLSERLMVALPAIRIRSDIERKRLYGIDETGTSNSGWTTGIYSPAASSAVYDRLYGHAETVLSAGHNVILDAAFLAIAERNRAMQAAGRAGCAAVLVDVRAPEALLRERVADRALEGNDASEADTTVITRQLAEYEPVKADEGTPVIICDIANGADVDGIIKKIRKVRQAGAA